MTMGPREAALRKLWVELRDPAVSRIAAMSTEEFEAALPPRSAMATEAQPAETLPWNRPLNAEEVEQRGRLEGGAVEAVKRMAELEAAAVADRRSGRVVRVKPCPVCEARRAKERAKKARQRAARR